MNKIHAPLETAREEALAAQRPQTLPGDGPQSFYPRRRAKGRDLILAGALLGLCFLLWDALCWAKGLGLGEALGLCALLPAALVYLRGRPKGLSPFGRLCGLLYLLGAGSLVLSGDILLKVLTMTAMIPLFLYAVLDRLGLWTGEGLSDRVRDLFWALFSMSFGRLGAGSWALLHRGEADGAASRNRRALWLGLACAVPALLVVVPLLIASDAAFEGLLGALDWLRVRRGLVALGLGGLTALLIFTLLFCSDRGPRARQGGRSRNLEPLSAAAFLGAISAAYVLYLLAQFAYFTDAFRGLLPKNYTVAQYARRGFFEMCAMVTINLCMLSAVQGLVRREGGKLPGAVKGLCLFLCLFSLGLVATALSKMVLYMGSFGLTRLRVLTSAFMGFLAVVVLAEGLRLLVGRLRVAKLALGLGMAVLILLSVLNVDGLVARYNVRAWRDGRLDSLDMKTVCWLGEGAVPTLLELARDPNPSIAEQAQASLDRRKPNKDLRSWNLITQLSNQALEDD